MSTYSDRWRRMRFAVFGGCALACWIVNEIQLSRGWSPWVTRAFAVSVFPMAALVVERLRLRDDRAKRVGPDLAPPNG